MKLLLFSFGICVALLGIGTRAEAQNYPWCAIYGGYDDGGTNCGFTTFQQCMDTRWVLAACANLLRNMFPRLGSAHPSKCEVTLLIERNPSRPSFVSDFAGDLRRVFEDLRERLSVAISNKQIQSMFAAEPGP